MEATNSLTNTKTQVRTQDYDEMKVWESLTPEQQQKVTEIKNAIDITDSQAIIQYGVQAQSNISSFSDTVLSQIRAKDSGRVGDILTELMVKVNELDVDSLGQNKGFSAKCSAALNPRPKNSSGSMRN